MLRPPTDATALAPDPWTDVLARAAEADRRTSLRATSDAEPFGPMTTEGGNGQPLDDLLDAVARFDPRGVRALLTAARAHVPDETVDALDEGASWLRDGVGDLVALRRATRASDPAASACVALLVEILVVTGSYADAIDVAMTAGGSRPPTPADVWSLRVSLDLADAHQALRNPGAADEVWASVRASPKIETDASLAGLAWQRRGVALIEREDLDGAERAFLNAATSWLDAPGEAGEAVEAFWSWRSALMVSGRGFEHDDATAGRAAAVPARRHPESDAAEQREAEGLRAHALGRAADAHTSLWQAFVLRRRRGQHFDTTRLVRLLGHVYEAADEPAAAAAMFVGCGAERETERAARDAPIRDLLDGLPIDGTRWERAASYAALSVRGREVPPEYAAEHAPGILREAIEPWTSIVSPQPVLRARNALATMYCALPVELRAPALEQLRQDVQSGFAGLTREAARALAQSTELEWSDETHLLVDVMLRDRHGLVAAIVGDLASRVAADPDLTRRVTDDAATGGRTALRLLLATGAPVADPRITDACGAVARAVGSSTISHGSGQTRIGMASFETAGTIGRGASARDRASLRANLAAIAGSAAEPLSNRASAINALFNLAGADDDVDDVLETVDALARGQIATSPLDDALAGNAFSRVQFSSGDVEDLQAAALSLLGRWRQLGRISGDGLTSLVLAGLLTQHPAVVAGALDLLTRNPALPVEVPLAPLAVHDDPRVRAAVATLVTVPGRFDAAAAGLLVGDSVPGVRSRLLALRPAEDHGRVLLGRLESDADAYVRARAARILSGP